MVYFKDTSSPAGVKHLIILDDARQPMESGTILAVHTPLVGPYANSWPRLTVPFRMKEWTREVSLNKAPTAWTLQSAYHRSSDETSPLLTLGRSIVEGKSKWAKDLQFPGEFHYIEGYWEWTEDILSRCKETLKTADVYDSVRASLFTYDRNSDIIKEFCEAWCPTTNTLLTSLGELSISLWDLHTLAGLPMTGLLYDEVVPEALELTGSSRGRRYVHDSCKSLFHAYHLLQKTARGGQLAVVSFEAWVSFWCKKPKKYSQPPLRKEKKSCRPKSTHNPTDDFGTHKAWTLTEERLFAQLGLEGSSREEAFLAAHVACWLCTFVLPTEDVGIIRPSTFKVASIIASGLPVDLAIPVLASIYKGLNKISKSTRPPQVYSPFPVHFVYGWLAHYFKTHYPLSQEMSGPRMIQFSGEGGARYYDAKEARKKIHKAELVFWTCNMLSIHQRIRYVDDANAAEVDQNYFKAIRSGFLPLREGDHFAIEPYSSHRFSRQFGFYQEVPGVLTKDIRRANLDEGIQHWRVCTLSKSNDRACFPSMPPNVKKFVSGDYKEWWSNVHGNFFDDNLAKLVDLKSIAVQTKDKEQDAGDKRKATVVLVDQSSASDTDRHWKRQKKDKKPSTEQFADELEDALLDLGSDESLGSVIGPNSLAMDQPLGKEVQTETPNVVEEFPEPQCPVISVFEGVKFVNDRKRQFLELLWVDLLKRIVNTAPDSISSIKDEVQLVLNDMKRFDSFDISHIESSLEILFTKAAAYDKAKSTSSEKPSEELISQKLSEAKDRLIDAEIEEQKEAWQVSATKDDLRQIKRKIRTLKKQQKDLLMSLKGQGFLHQAAQRRVYEIKEEIDAVGKTLLQDTEALGEVKKGVELLEAAKENLKNLKLFD